MKCGELIFILDYFTIVSAVSILIVALLQTSRGAGRLRSREGGSKVVVGFAIGVYEETLRYDTCDIFDTAG